MEQRFSCKVFTSKNVTEMSKTRLKKRKSEGGNWKTSLAQPRFRLHMRLLAMEGRKYKTEDKYVRKWVYSMYILRLFLVHFGKHLTVSTQKTIQI